MQTSYLEEISTGLIHNNRFQVKKSSLEQTENRYIKWQLELRAERSSPTPNCQLPYTFRQSRRAQTVRPTSVQCLQVWRCAHTIVPKTQGNLFRQFFSLGHMLHLVISCKRCEDLVLIEWGFGWAKKFKAFASGIWSFWALWKGPHFEGAVYYSKVTPTMNTFNGIGDQRCSNRQKSFWL